MELMPEELRERFEQVGEQNSPPIIVAHYFNPCGRGDWYAAEYEPEDRIFYGFVSLFGDHNDEWGYFRLEELEGYEDQIFKLGIERDLHWKEVPATQVDRIRERCPWMLEVANDSK